MAVNFSIPDNFSESKNFSLVKFGQVGKLLEVELNELQKIQNYQRGLMARLTMSNGFNAGTSMTISSGVLTVPADTILVNGDFIVIAENMTLSVSTSDVIYLAVSEVEVNSLTTLQKSGNLSGGSSITNDLIDVRMGIETTHRFQKQVQLVKSTADLSKIYLPVATITGATTFADNRSRLGLTALAAHQAETASQSVGKGASLVGINDAGSIISATTVEGALQELASRPTSDPNNGRYQSQQNFDGTETLVSTLLSNNTVTINGVNGTSLGTSTNRNAAVSTAMSGLKIHANTTLTGFGVNLTVEGTASTLYLTDSSKTVLATKDIAGIGSGTVYINYPMIAGTDYWLMVDNNGASYIAPSSNTYLPPQTSTNFSVTDGWSDGTEQMWWQVFSNITAQKPALTGTATKTITPSDLKKWGNLKWAQTASAPGSSVVCDVLDTSDNVLLAGVTSIADLSSINIATYPSLDIRWTLNRLATTDASPTVSAPSVSWEGSIVSKNATGVYSDTSTVVGANATYVKTIPLGFNATKGRLVIKSTAGGVSLITLTQISFNTVVDDAISFQFGDVATGQTSFNSTLGLGTDPYLVRDNNGNGGISISQNIAIRSVVITGSNLVITFKNTQASDDNFEINRLYWEVEG